MRWFGFGRAFACGPCFLVVLLMTSGCAKEPLPKTDTVKTYTVKGKVVYKNGKPCTGGSITLASVANPEQRGYGNIAEDGTFMLNTITRNNTGSSKLLQGAVEGEFRVTIRPSSYDSGDNDAPSDSIRAPAFTLSKTYKIEAKEDNELTVVIE